MAPLSPLAALILAWIWARRWQSSWALGVLAMVLALVLMSVKTLAVFLPHVAPLRFHSILNAFETLGPLAPFLTTHQRWIPALVAHSIHRVVGHMKAAVEPQRKVFGAIFDFYVLPPE